MRKLLLLLALASSPLFATAHQYWRVSGNSQNLVAIGQLIFYDSGGSTISTSGGTASASDCYGGCGGSFGPSNAFNGTTDCSTFWLANSNPAWLEMAFTGAVAVDHITAYVGCNGGRGFGYSLQLQYSDNNSTWTTQNEWDGVDAANSPVTLTPANAAPASPAIYWRLSFASSSCVGMSALKFFTLANAGGTQISTSQYAATDSSIFNDETAGMSAITLNGAGNGWQSGGGGSAQTWTYAFSTLASPGSVQYSNAGSGGCGQVNNLTVLYSTDNVTYTSAGSFSPTWSGTQTKTFNITGGPGGFVPGVSPFMVPN